MKNSLKLVAAALAALTLSACVGFVAPVPVATTSTTTTYVAPRASYDAYSPGAGAYGGSGGAYDRRY
jgi:hypothetical protein